MLASLALLHHWISPWASELVGNGVAGAHARDDADAAAPDGMGAFSWPPSLALLAFPPVVSAIMMILDLTLGTSFFMPAVVSMGKQTGHAGGNRCCFQTPVLVLRPSRGLHRRPAGLGIVSDCSVSMQEKHLGYRMMVWAIVAIGALSSWCGRTTCTSAAEPYSASFSPPPR